MSIRLVLAFTAAMALCGCTSPPQSIIDRSDPIPVQSIATEVALAPGTESRIEPIVMFGNPRHPFMTGEVWQASFPRGNGQQRALLRIESSTLRWELVALGFASKFSYSVKALLEEGGRTTPLSAEGYQHTAMQDPPTPVRMAMIMAITAIAEQAAAALSPKEKAPNRTAAQRLRDLEALWREKLITEEEYLARRHVLLQEL